MTFSDPLGSSAPWCKEQGCQLDILEFHFKWTYGLVIKSTRFWILIKFGDEEAMLPVSMAVRLCMFVFAQYIAALL